MSGRSARLPRHAPGGSAYLVPDLLRQGLELVFCGTAPSRASASARAYYAKPGNRFWPTLHRVGITPRRVAPHEYSQLLTFGVGLTDLCKGHCGTDAELPRDAFDFVALEWKVRRYAPRWVAFTSKNAAQALLRRKVDYGPQPETIAATRLYVLPSPSGLATRFWDEQWWRELARLIGRRSTAAMENRG